MTAEEIAKSEADRAQCQAAIEQWIITHAVHPETYRPIAFDKFSVAQHWNGDDPVPGSETYTVHHVHQMLTNQGDTATFSGYFLLDNDFRVSIIEVNGMQAIGVGTYPEWEAWTDLFGRTMTAEDSSEWRSRSNRKFLHEMEQVRDRMNAGDAYVVGASKDSAKALMDIVINALKK